MNVVGLIFLKILFTTKKKKIKTYNNPRVMKTAEINMFHTLSNNLLCFKHRNVSLKVNQVFRSI